jgi:dUTP pyrophosphatase
MRVRERFTSAGFDLFANAGYKLAPGERKLIHTGVALSIPHGFYGRLVALPGPALKFGVDVLAGLVDSHHREEIEVLLSNGGNHNFLVQPGDRIAQLVIEAILSPEAIKVDDL